MGSLGEDAAVRIWDIATSRCLQEIKRPMHGAISCFSWVSRHQEDSQAFCFGTADGSIHLFAQQSKEVRCSLITVSTNDILLSRVNSRIKALHQLLTTTLVSSVSLTILCINE
jgi:WD40 repeat protein